MTTKQLSKPALLLGILTLAIVILVYAKPFLVPLTFAAILSMLLLPVVKWLQRKKVPHALAIVICILLLIAFFGLVILFMSWQISDLAQNSSSLEQQVTRKYNEARQYIAESLGISPEKQQQFLEKQQSSGTGNTGSLLSGAVSGIFGFLTDVILVLVYIFLFIFFSWKTNRFYPQDHAAGKICRSSENSQ